MHTDPSTGGAYYQNINDPTAPTTFERPTEPAPSGKSGAAPQPAPTQQMQPQPQPTGALKGWSGGRFDCFSDPFSCIFVWCCPCIAFGQDNERLGPEFGGCAMTGFIYFLLDHILKIVVMAVISAFVGGDVGAGVGSIISALAVGYFAFQKRKMMTEKYNNTGVANLVWEGDGYEFFCWCCCAPCTLCQEYRTIIKDQNVLIDGTWDTNTNANGNPVAIQMYPPQAQTQPQAQMPHAQPQVQAVPVDAQPPAYDGPPLPEGWTASSDASGRTFYYNSVTQESTYEHPCPPAGPGAEGRGCCGAV